MLMLENSVLLLLLIIIIIIRSADTAIFSDTEIGL